MVWLLHVACGLTMKAWRRGTCPLSWPRYNLSALVVAQAYKLRHLILVRRNTHICITKSSSVGVAPREFADERTECSTRHIVAHRYTYLKPAPGLLTHLHSEPRDKAQGIARVQTMLEEGVKLHGLHRSMEKLMYVSGAAYTTWYIYIYIYIKKEKKIYIYISTYVAQSEHTTTPHLVTLIRVIRRLLQTYVLELRKSHVSAMGAIGSASDGMQDSAIKCC